MAGDMDLEMVIEHNPPFEGGFGRTPQNQRSRLDPSERRHRLTDAVQRHALPRLIAAMGARDAASPTGIGEADVGTLLGQIVSPDFHLLEATVALLGLRGVGREDLVLNLLAPVARLLHEQWLRDDATFADVTLAVGRLQRLLRSPSMPQPSPGYGPACGSVLISPPPGEVHAFGSAVLADFFRNAHWDADRVLPSCEDELAALVSAKPFDVLALSVSQDASLPSATLLIRRLRRCALNGQMMVMIGGVTLQGDPEAWRRVGADASAPDAAHAVTVANRWLGAALRGSRTRP